VESFSSDKYLTISSSLKRWEVEDYDRYFDVKREKTKNSPAFLVIRSLLMAYKTFLVIRYFYPPKNQENSDDSLLIWKKYHWIFFVFMQGKILSFIHFKKQMRQENIVQIGSILKLMSQLMLASGASMLFAGASQRKAYENEIRPSMMPPNVNSPDFSGLMSYDHAYLIYLWNQEKELFKLIPPFLKLPYEEFLDAHKFLALAHKFVCQKYGGDEGGSLREKKVTALENLEILNASRRRLIINSNSHVLEPNSHLILLKDESRYENYIKMGLKSYSELLLKSFM